MKNHFLLLFISIVSAIYLLGCWYVFHRGSQAIPSAQGRVVFAWVFWLLAASFIVGQVLERGNYHFITTVITGIGSTWLAVLWYSFLLVLVIDIVRLLNRFLHFIPGTIPSHYLFFGVAGFVLVVVASGMLNAAFPHVHQMDVTIDKPVEGNKKELTIALVSDIHMGFIIGNGHVSRLVESINATHPDMVILAGDLVDHNPKPVVQENLGRHFSLLKAPLGVYAVTGNHEYIGHPEISVNYLSKFGIRYLRDTMIEVNGIQLAGRDDSQKIRFTGKPRKDLARLLSNAQQAKPLILIDHQPVEYDKAQQQGVDLMLSGHTHDGQVWPFKYIANKVYNISEGIMTQGKSHFYVSSGYGTWGPPVRLGNRPEIALIKIHFK
ncbi:MAG: metallophosphoesterase [Paludibacteraceae bacterium]|nr:metallophosphoesterase [Paludibacteraceae bacterium]